MFSNRLPDDLAPNALTRAIAARCQAGLPLLDLTLSNPTRAGLAYPTDWLAALADARTLAYDPNPRGLESARQAVAAYYSGRDVEVDPERVVLTASTSEAYALLLKVVADAGDELLVPTPSYPLFEHLARAECVVPKPYRLDPATRWRLEVSSLRAAASDRTRAVVVVSPNNPTGSRLRDDELGDLASFCIERNLALICDEVFADYVYGGIGHSICTAAHSACLTFTLNGLSKAAALPQLKLAWIVVSGPDHEVVEALARLEFAADLFLSPSTPVQYAVPAILAEAPRLRATLQARLLQNRTTIERVVGSHPALRLQPVEAGWYAVLETPRFGGEEELVVDLVASHGVLVHPGYFFDFPKDGILVVSLLPDPAVFAAGIELVCRRAAAGAAGA
jgi:hypothetical protein